MQRRGFITGLVGAFVAPAIVRADSLMKLSVPKPEFILPDLRNRLLTSDEIVREAVKLFRNTEVFLTGLDLQHDESFAQAGKRIGETLQIRVPHDFF